MASNEPQRPNNPPQQQQKGGGPQRRKSFMDSTTVIGLAIWLATTIIFAVALVNVVINVPTACRDINGLVVPGCVTQLVGSAGVIPVFIVAIILKFVLAQGSRRFRDPTWRFWFNMSDRALNFFWIYWLFTLQFGFIPGLKAIITTITSNADVYTLVGTAVYVAASVVLEKLDDAFFDIPGGRK